MTDHKKLSSLVIDVADWLQNGRGYELSIETLKAAEGVGIHIAVKSRRTREKLFQDAIGRVFEKYKQDLIAAALDGQITPQELALMRQALRTEINTQLLHAAQERAKELGRQLALSPDNDALTRLLDQWARGKANEVTDGIINTTRDRLESLYRLQIDAGEPLTQDQIGGVIDYTLGDARAETIAATELTRARSFALSVYEDQLNEMGIQADTRWLTEEDELVCFPAGTMITTGDGAAPIERVGIGSQVMTRKGLRRVVAVSKRLYSGPMTALQTSIGWVMATANHPFWTLEQGWLECRNLNSRHILQTVNDEPVNVLSILNFSLGNSQNAPAMCFDIPCLSRIPSGVAMPVGAVNFQSHTQAGQKKINAISAHMGLLGVLNSEIVKRMTDFLFKQIFALEGTITGEAAKLAVSITRKSAKDFPAISADDIDGWAAAFLAAKMSGPSFLGTHKYLAASFAGSGDALVSTFPTANSKSIRNGGGNTEGLSALRAHFGDKHFSAGGAVTGIGTEFLSALGAGGRNVESSTTMFTLAVLPRSPSLGWIKAQIIRIYRHGLQLLSNLRELYHVLSGKAIYVYNLQVEDVSEFYANGILVHNCPICGPLDHSLEWEAQFPEGPPAHPNCRCTLVLERPQDLPIP